MHQPIDGASVAVPVDAAQTAKWERHKARAFKLFGRSFLVAIAGAVAILVGGQLVTSSLNGQSQVAQRWVGGVFMIVVV